MSIKVFKPGKMYNLLKFNLKTKIAHSNQWKYNCHSGS
jgi:hypothetical protein